MAKNLHLHIPEPCHENWDNMTPDQRGRFCMSCQKTVVDFANMSDQEVIQYFNNLKGNTCGRFQDEQLNRDLRSPGQSRLKWYKYFLQVMIPALLVTSKSYSQGEIKSKPTICISPIDNSPKIKDAKIVLGGASAVRYDLMVNGTVVDENKNAVPYATVMIKGTKQGVAADAAGNYSLKASTSFPFTIVASAVGFAAREIIVQKQNVDKLNIVLEMQSATYGIVVVGYPRRKRKPNVYHQFKQVVTDSLKITTPKVYPNPLPIGSLLTIEYAVKKDGEYTVELFDQNGQLFQVERFEARRGPLQKQIRLKEGVVAGTYIINLIGPDNIRISSQKFIANM